MSDHPLTTLCDNTLTICDITLTVRDNTLTICDNLIVCDSTHDIRDTLIASDGTVCDSNDTIFSLGIETETGVHGKRGAMDE